MTRLALVMGDPAGIGGELMAGLLADPELGDARVVVIGDRRVLSAGEAVAGVELGLPVVRTPEAALASNERIVVLDMTNLDPGSICLGEVSAEGGRSVLQNLGAALAMAQRGEVDAITFTPFNKQALKLGGNPFNDELDHGRVGPRRYRRRVQRARPAMERPRHLARAAARRRRPADGRADRLAPAADRGDHARRRRRAPAGRRGGAEPPCRRGRRVRHRGRRGDRPSRRRGQDVRPQRKGAVPTPCSCEPATAISTLS